ncbi:nickel-responsive transcriptional regulator NikR [Helicobacter suis]|uniref:Putative nickel-responsive regulator n=2 Tax=Helicobacter suis TaxID=104628 RepID=E7G4Z6_9HELI|nr:nickel-responsive transcriptional regulator NikR [Helicobacter suis]EFX41556.1 nickel responsive regulator [Helicobacter suis HS5]EFX43544.1 nickel responsive regulator [Helicobacter suis HS1]BCD45232.1 Nickel responsive regulator NikR [Helicobacter suis]BCD48793.1 Nickel responsive regulator NikR [Helicobacter suis]BCD50574.1 Nickel responsive regulator NikR [Helicobacter suis]
MEHREDAIIRFSVSLQQNLLDELDNRIIRNGYSSRSELVRDMIRERLVEDSWSKEQTSEVNGGLTVAVLVIIYDHHQRELNQRMIDIQHESHISILCTTHVHLNANNCLETIILRGKPADIMHLHLEIGGLKGVKFSKLTKASSFEQNT